jgi:tetratricopeptide (TPR) repeat protein
MKPLFLLAALIIVAPSLALAGISEARKAADAIQDKNYAGAVEILDGDLAAMAEKDKAFSADELLYLSAIARFHLKDYAAAEASCDRLLKDFPDSEWLHKAVFLKAKTRVARNDYEKAIGIYETESKRLFAPERKAEIARDLIRFAEIFGENPASDDIGAPAPDYDRAYQLYSEILDFDCGLPLRARARYEMTRMRSLGGKYVETESEALAYLKEFDPTWRGLIASPERVTLKKNAKALATGKEIAAVRMLHAEALHRLDRRPEADRYLFELIQLINDGAIKAGKALLADATWLRLQTLRRKGGMAYDIDEWKLAAIDYLKADPDHIHANRTAWVLGYLLNRHGKGAEAIEAYRNYLADIYHTGVRANPLTVEKESPSALEARKSLAGSHRESAHFAIGEIYFQKGEFDQARKAWSGTARLFPNGAKWADCQKGLVEIDYAQLIHNIKQLEKKSRADNELAQAGKADELIAGFIARYPLDSRIPGLLLEGGMFAFRLGKKLDDENELVRPTPKTKDRQDRLFRHAIESWRILLSKYGRSTDAVRAKFLTATLWEERFGDMEKAVGLYQGSKAAEFRTRLVALTSKRLLASCEHAFRLDETPRITLDTRNIESVKVHQYWLDLESYFLKNGNLEQATRLDVDLVEPDRTWEVKIKGKKYHPVSQKIDIPFPQGKPGVCIIKIEEEDYYTTCLVMRSNIDVSVRAGKEEIIAFVMNWATGKPAADVKILLASGEKIIATEKTGRDGVMKRKLPDLKDLDRLRVLAVSPDGCATSEQSLTGTFSPPALKPVAWFHTATAENRPGDMVRLYGVVRDARDGAYVLPKDLDYTLKCRTAAGHAIFTSPVKLDARGGFVTEFKIPEEARGSLISVVLRNAKKKSAPLFSYSVPITCSARWSAVLELGFDKENIETGDILTGEVAATYRWGAPVSHRRIRVTLPSGNDTEVITDAAGKASFRYDTTGIASGSALTFSASLVGIPCRGAAHTVVVDPLQLYIEAEADKATMTEGEEVSIEVATRDAREKSVGANLTLKLIRVERDEPPGCIPSLSVREKLVQTAAIITDAGTGKGRVMLAVKEEGRYILRIEGVDPRGKPSLAETGLTVLGENAPSALVAYHHTQRLYDDGVCQLRVFSKLKSNGRALLTIEGDENLAYRLVDIRPGVNTIELPLSARHAPVFRAALMCMHERRFYSAEDVITVDRKLHVKTTVPNLRDGRAEPGGALDLRVEVSDTAGRPVPALLMLALNPCTRSASDAEPVLCSPFQRANRLAEYSMSTSCGFSSVGLQGTILARLKEEEQRLALGNGQAHRIDDLRRLGEDRFKRNDQIRRLLYVGEGSFNLGDYTKAKVSFEQVLQIDRYNAPARRWLERVAAAKSSYYRAAYDHTRAQLLSQVDAQWQAELPNSVGGNISNAVTGGNRSGDGAITRNSIDSILNNPNRTQGAGRNSLDFFLNNPDRQSTIRSNALAVSITENSFKNNPNRLNQQAFVGGGAFVNYGAELTNNDPFGSQSETGGDFINPIESTVIAGIPFIDPFDDSRRAFTGSDRSLGFSRGTDIKLLTAGTSSVKIPLPDQAGKWDLSAIAVGKSGRMGIDTRGIETSVPVSLKFQELTGVMAGDVFSPVLAIHRNNADEAQSLHVTGTIKLGGKNSASDRSGSPNEGENRLAGPYSSRDHGPGVGDARACCGGISEGAGLSRGTKGGHPPRGRASCEPPDAGDARRR